MNEETPKQAASYGDPDNVRTSETSLTPEEERLIQRSYDHLVSGVKQPEYRCRRCGERVNMVAMRCGCKSGPSPWEHVEQPQPTPASYGEPWPTLKNHGGLIYKLGPDGIGVGQPLLEAKNTRQQENADRVVQCWNACAGIADPEKAIQAAREALASVLAWVWPDSEEDGQHSACYTPDSSIGEVHPVIDGDKFRAALAQLNTTIMTTINDQPQHLLARYADRTGCHYLLSKDSGPEWQAPRYPSAREYHQLGWTIRLVLSEYGLPSHQPPYKDNPRLPGNGYRVPTGEDRCGQPHELWNDEEWIAARQVDVDFSNLSGDYRLPASVLPPDWDEMTREDAPTWANSPVHEMLNQMPDEEPLGTAEVSPHPEIFEAHGLEWYRHTPGDPMPCEPNKMVKIFLSGHSNNAGNANHPADQFIWKSGCGIIGWRPADAPAKLPRPEQQPQDDVQALKARVQELEGERNAWKLTAEQRKAGIDQLEKDLAKAKWQISASTPSLFEDGEEKSMGVVVRERDDARENADKLKAQLAAASTPTLRPIAEMPAEVPEGCVRVFGGYYENQGEWIISSWSHPQDTHFLDIRLPAPPDPDAELRREFEAWWKAQPDRAGKHKSECYEAYKAGRCAHPQGATA